MTKVSQEWFSLAATNRLAGKETGGGLKEKQRGWLRGQEDSKILLWNIATCRMAKSGRKKVSRHGDSRFRESSRFRGCFHPCPLQFRRFLSNEPTVADDRLASFTIFRPISRQPASLKSSILRSFAFHFEKLFMKYVDSSLKLICSSSWELLWMLFEEFLFFRWLSSVKSLMGLWDYRRLFVFADFWDKWLMDEGGI